jgi:hypothetical protein
MLDIKLPSLSQEMRLLLACCRKTLGEADPEKIRWLSNNQIDWESFLRLADRHRVYPLVYHNLSRLARNGIPAHILRSLKDRFERNALRALALTAEMVRLVKLLEQNGILALPLKGPPLALQVYGDLALRHSGDLDLLVAAEHVEHAENILRQKGYRRVVPDLTLSRIKRQIVYMRQGQHFIYYNEYSQRLVELHWRLFSNSYIYSLNIDKLLECSQTINIASNPIETLDIEKTILYLCTHGAIHIWYRLFWLCDVVELLQKNYRIYWPEMMEHATELGLSRSLAEGLMLSSLLFGTSLPDPIRAYVERDNMVKSLVKTALLIATHPNDMTRTPFSLTPIHMLRKFHGSRLHNNLRYKIIFYLSEISPPLNDLKAIPLPDYLLLLYYLLRPFMWLWRRIK